MTSVRRSTAPTPKVHRCPATFVTRGPPPVIRLERHLATRTSNGLVVTEVCDSREAHERFVSDRLGAALAGAEIAPPAQVLDGELLTTFGRR